MSLNDIAGPPGFRRIRPLIPTAPPSADDVTDLLEQARDVASRPTVELLEYLARLTPLERLYHATAVVLRRLSESAGAAPEPCFVAEEQFMLNELSWATQVPERLVAVAARLLCVSERYAVTRFHRRAAEELTHTTNRGAPNG